MRPPLLLAAIPALALCSCFSPGEGQSPPLDTVYFPTGLALDPTPAGEAPKYLYVASSDFDLQYRSSALLSYDLERVREVIPRNCNVDDQCRSGEVCDNADSGSAWPSYFCVADIDEPCGPLRERAPEDQLQNPGRCLAVNPLVPQDGGASLRRDSVGIGAFATEVISRQKDGQSRLFLPVRGDATLHWIDINDGLFECGQNNNSDRACDGLHRAGDAPDDNDDRLRQPAEPFGIATLADADFIAVTNQTTGSVSLFQDGFDNDGPRLASVLTGLPTTPVAIAAVPQPSTALVPAEDFRPSFLVAYRNAPQLDLLRVRVDPAVTNSDGDSYTRFGLSDVGTVGITANAAGFDSRGIVIDDSQRQADYAACADGDTACLLAATQPKIYLTNRAPASRVVLGSVKVVGSTLDDDDGTGTYDLEQRVFAICYDSRRIFIYDPKRRVVEGIVSTGRGPYALAIDTKRALGYVGHFTDSYLGVVSLDQRFPQTYATLVAGIGTPSPPRSSK